MELKNFNNIYKEINNLSLFIKNKIKKITNKKQIYHYSKKSDITDALLFHLLKTQNNSTQSSVSTFLSINNKKKITRQGIVKRANNVSIDILNDLYNDLTNKFNSNTKNDLIYNIIDGTTINIYNNNHKYKTINLLGILTNNVNSNIYKNNLIDSSEISLFYHYINNNYFDKNNLFILDRLYFSYKLVNTFYEKNIKFLCRIKSNSHLLNKFNEKHNKNNKITEMSYDELINDKKVKVIIFKAKNVFIYLTTNLLDDKYDIEFYKETYKKRWLIETNFKILKTNTNLDNIKTKKEEKINKELKSINIISFLYNYILKVYIKYDQNKNKKKINKTTFIKKFYDFLLYKLVKGKLNLKTLSFLLKIIIEYYYDSNKKNNPKFAIMPYKKWNKKGRYKKYKDEEKNKTKTKVKNKKIKKY